VAAARDQYADPERFRPVLPGGVKQVLYDLENDPWQVCPIYPGQGHHEVMKDLHGRLAAWLDRLGDPFLQEGWE
jgi:hypothetical protein